ncbi:MAG: ATPase, F0 complex, subunit B, bacterial [candidate division CPR2 bacterium GW2011_GWC1_39_9]|uniref:ATP synthase subunit b n=1 Tax=candidate division CPR2 bacterium GW2011_GWC2_39_10 TaxID=1618345 RepID=A0A0G0PZ40_UNCC2|nr:MAG: ATP synthase subunit b [candidate division CPR2 bacterium GW2011_GWC2_39_10]KKR36125.1 MAG: ATPase, F0 complex, subunit B, bacterial [candidate division CPR2 bacterium GW2011_GWC1_39_9]
MADWLINIFITSVCLFTLGLYFTYRERELEAIAKSKLDETKEKYLDQIAKRKAREREEISKLQAIVAEIEKKHQEVEVARQNIGQGSERGAGQNVSNVSTEEAEKILESARERAAEIEEEAKKKADEFLDKQKKEVQTKMVDLVMGVVKKVIGQLVSYEDHKKIIKSALDDMEGEGKR